MKKIIIAAAVIAVSSCLAKSQMMPPGAMMHGDMGKEYLEKLEKENPALYKFEKQLVDIRQQIREIAAAFQSDKMSKSEAKQKLIPLIKQEMEIMDNPEYKVEQKLNFMLLKRPPMPHNLQQMPPDAMPKKGRRAQ